MKLGPLQCLTNAPEDYDYSSQHTLVEKVATGTNGKVWRLCENDDDWHLQHQIMRYGSGMFQGISDQNQLDEWFDGDNPLLVLTDSPVYLFRFRVDLHNYLYSDEEERRRILDLMEAEIPGVKVEHKNMECVFTCQGVQAVKDFRKVMKNVKFDTYGPQPNVVHRKPGSPCLGHLLGRQRKTTTGD